MDAAPGDADTALGDADTALGDVDAALDDVAFLANTDNRVAVCEALAEGPRSREEVRDRVDASRVTVARILRELEARGWVERSGRTYAVTPLGEWVCEAFARLVGEVAAAHRLRRPLQWLPFDLLTFDVRRLRDAEIVLLDGTDVTALVRRLLELLGSSERVRSVARGTAPVFVETQWELTVRGETELDLVLTPAALAVVRNHPTTARQFREMLAEETVRCSVCEDVPVSVVVADGAVGITLTDDQGVLRGGLVTEDDVVRAWAVDRFETCRDSASTLDPDAVAA